MSDEGVRLISRLALLAVLIVATAFARALFGSGTRRGRYLLAGTLGGILAGWRLAIPISRWLAADVSALCACVGIIAGWRVSWLFARHVPRDAR